jgi:hypothetical protein
VLFILSYLVQPTNLGKIRNNFIYIGSEVRGSYFNPHVGRDKIREGGACEIINASLLSSPGSTLRTSANITIAQPVYLNQLFLPSSLFQGSNFDIL